MLVLVSVILGCKLLPHKCPVSQGTPGWWSRECPGQFEALAGKRLSPALGWLFGLEPFTPHGWCDSSPSVCDPSFKAGDTCPAPGLSWRHYPSPFCWASVYLVSVPWRWQEFGLTCGCGFSPGPAWKGTLLFQSGIWRTPCFVFKCSFVFVIYFPLISTCSKLT